MFVINLLTLYCYNCCQYWLLVCERTTNNKVVCRCNSV